MVVTKRGRMTTSCLRGSCLVASLLWCLSVVAAEGQSVRGVVRDSVTNHPLAGARVVLIGASPRDVSTTTDSAGSFVLTSAQMDSVRLEVQRVGYVSLMTPPLTLTGHDTIQVDLKLTPAPIGLEPISAATTVQSWNLSQFRERQRTGWGRYLGPEQIAALPPRTGVQAVLRVGGGQFLADDRGNGLLMRSMNGAYCVPRVFIDGTVQMPPDPNRRLPGNRRPAGLNIDALITPASIRGVEVYYRATDAPVEYHKALDSECGIVVLWTDRGLGIR